MTPVGGLADETLNAEAVEPTLAKAPNPDAGLKVPDAAAENGEFDAWFANAPKPVAGFIKLDELDVGVV